MVAHQSLFAWQGRVFLSSREESFACRNLYDTLIELAGVLMTRESLLNLTVYRVVFQDVLAVEALTTLVALKRPTVDKVIRTEHIWNF